ncbi:MAG: single-stranded-DNA-specific exonuclease RecJ [Lachnospiraceae bacterium]|nr:single-stranded-DNA-specific exonuclease RecJ [Lachnospiraceae bacterium]
MEKWMMAAKKADFNQIAQRFSIDPVIARIIRNRDVIGEEAIAEYLHGDLTTMHDPALMKDMEKAAGIIREKIRQKAHIRILGDYDIDGIMSTFILLKGFTRLGANVDYMIPNRITDGYGINEHLIQTAKEDGVDTIVTCDNGIAAIDQIQMAKDMGMTVVVTDHHEVQKGRIPGADAVVNPKQADCPYPFKGLCGGAVAYKLMEQLFRMEELPGDAVWEYLEYAAFATVGDIMDLTGENRVLVKEGLKRLRKTSNLGLRELMRANNLEPEDIKAYHIGFILGPCLNASGRLDTAKRSLELLRAGEREEAARLAGDLKSLNDSRKDMTLTGVEAAVKQVEETGILQDRVFVIFLPDCHESLAGIIAGRIKETYHHPTYVLTRGEAGVKGSGRSIEEYPMFDELVKCDDLLGKYGGHPMAAGVSLEEANIPLFRQRLNANCSLEEKDFVPKVSIDVPMPISYVNRELIGQLNLLEPFGKANPKPLFAQKDLQVLDSRIMGKNRNVLKMRVSDGHGAPMDAIYFGDVEPLSARLQMQTPLTIAYYPGINSYNGKESLQLIIQHFY